MHKNNGYTAAWTAAVDTYAHLASGGQIDPIELTIPGLTPEPGEYAVGVFARARGVLINYARYYAVDVTYSTPSTVLFGSPAFVVGGLIGSAFARSRIRKRAQREAAPQWRTTYLTCVVVTTRRIWCEIAEQAGPRWLNFNYDQITTFNLTGTSMTLGFLQAVPLQLTGDWVPWCAAVIAHYRYGHAAGSAVPSLQANIG